MIAQKVSAPPCPQEARPHHPVHPQSLLHRLCFRQNVLKRKKMRTKTIARIQPSKRPLENTPVSAASHSQHPGISLDTQGSTPVKRTTNAHNPAAVLDLADKTTACNISERTKEAVLIRDRPGRREPKHQSSLPTPTNTRRTASIISPIRHSPKRAV